MAKNEITFEINKALDDFENEIVENLLVAGEEAVRQMRGSKQNDYTDRTGNLRSSTGFALAKNGQIIETSDFAPITAKSTGMVGTEGSNTGKQLAVQSATQNSGPNTYALVLMAGMDYAGYVQANGYDVIESASLEAEKRIKEFLD